MKRLLSFFFFFLGIFAAFFALLAVLNFLVILAWFSPIEHTFSLIMQEARAVFLRCLLGAVLIAVTFLHIRGTRIFQTKAASIFIPFCFSLLVFVPLFFLFAGMYQRRRVELNAYSYFLPNRINQVDGDLLYIDEMQSNRFRNVIFIDIPQSSFPSLRGSGETPPPVLSYFSKGDADIGSSGLAVSLGGEEKVTLKGKSPQVHAGVFQAPATVQSLLSEIESLVVELEELFEVRKLSFLLAVVPIMFFFAAASVFLRLTRWPLCNILLFIFSGRSALFVLHFVHTRIVAELAKLMEVQNTVFFVLRLSPVMLVMGVGILLFFVDLLFVPDRR